ncbi:dual specificity protein phosphatase 22 isoform X5 [Tursiops truncatus]|uniref:dual specificity protein phosphatase 22 isoform X5 n=1 Tax=Tursiops truncatus TaxID=9739 RepID=UPI003CCF9E87
MHSSSGFTISKPNLTAAARGCSWSGQMATLLEPRQDASASAEAGTVLHVWGKDPSSPGQDISKKVFSSSTSAACEVRAALFTGQAGFRSEPSESPTLPCLCGSWPCSLAGVSRSVTLVVAYIMTVTDFGWEDALRTVRAGRSCANPNLGFQRQLQEFEEHQVCQFRQWLKEEYGESPLRDAEEARGILGKYKEQGRAEPPPGARRWGGLPASPPLAYGSCTTET